MKRPVALAMLLCACEAPRGVDMAGVPMFDGGDAAEIVTVDAGEDSSHGPPDLMVLPGKPDLALASDLSSTPADFAQAPTCAAPGSSCTTFDQCCDGAATNPPGSVTWQPACSSGHCCTTFAEYTGCAGGHFRVCSNCGAFGGETCGGCQ